MAAGEPLIRMIDIVAELLAGVRGGKLPMNQELAELYLFLFRRVLEAKIHSDVEKLAEVLRLLEYERQTWQLICEKPSGESPAASSSKVSGTMPHPPHTTTATSGLSSLAASSGFSLEA